jgi:hypothetical protein
MAKPQIYLARFLGTRWITPGRCKQCPTAGRDHSDETPRLRTLIQTIEGTLTASTDGSNSSALPLKAIIGRKIA